MAPIFIPSIVGYIVAVLITTAATTAMVARHTRHQFQQNMKQLASSRGDSLAKARQLVPPKNSLTTGGENENAEFWNQHHPLLQDAWTEWWQDYGKHRLASLSGPETKEKMINPQLQDAVAKLRENPTQENEEELKQLFQTVIPNQVYQIPLLTPEGIRKIRQHIDAASYYYNPQDSSDIAAGIPTRRPNGMNRFGIIINRNVEGSVSYDGINDFMEQLAQDYIRPLGRTFFNELTSRHHPEDDSETYAFTIRYQPKEGGEGDLKLNEHSDASIYTLNINLNLVGEDSQTVEEYEGSSLYFLDENTKEKVPVTFEPGTAYLHKGLVRHAATPITAGERHNLVVWLFGDGGYVRFGPYDEEERLTVQERWGDNGSNDDENRKYRIDPSIVDL